MILQPYTKHPYESNMDLLLSLFSTLLPEHMSHATAARTRHIGLFVHCRRCWNTLVSANGRHSDCNSSTLPNCRESKRPSALSQKDLRLVELLEIRLNLILHINARQLLTLNTSITYCQATSLSLAHFPESTPLALDVRSFQLKSLLKSIHRKGYQLRNFSKLYKYNSQRNVG